VQNGQTGDTIKTFSSVSNDTISFITVDSISYGANTASAAKMGLDPAQLRDYDGNNLGEASSWHMIGLAGVRVGAEPSYILVNPDNGRWAEVAVQSNGSINMSNFGQNGDTRVVGIYKDPLVQSGSIQAGSALDSEARLISDVRADRLAVLGSMQDPGQAGFQDLFFKLTNHSADHHDDVYLRAVLWGDGNIQYANYMNASQFTTFMSDHGVTAAVYNNWLTKA